MLSDIIDTIPHDAHRNIMPWHASILRLAQLITLPIIHRLEIHHPIIIKILARPDLGCNTFRMHISQGMLVSVPATETKINATDEGSVVVDHDEFLVVCPIEGHICSVLKDIVVGMAHDHYVSMALATLGTEALESVLRVRGVTGQSSLNYQISVSVYDERMA